MLQEIINVMVDLAKEYPAAMYTYPLGDDKELSYLLKGPVYRLEDEVIFHGSLLGQAIMRANPGQHTVARLNNFDTARWPVTWWSVAVEYLGYEIEKEVGHALNSVQENHDQGETWAYSIEPLLKFASR